MQSFNSQIIKLNKAFDKGLPGDGAHSRMAPAHRDRLISTSKGPEFARKSSVLILLFPDNKEDINTVFIKRMEYEGVHSGQVAFPGGKHEDTDVDLVATALREAEEEIGLVKEAVGVIAKLSDLFVPPSNFIISPVVAQLPYQPQLIPDRSEVAEIFMVPLKHFLKPENFGDYEIKISNGQSILVPGYYYKTHLIWGATAMILSELLEVFINSGIMDE